MTTTGQDEEANKRRKAYVHNVIRRLRMALPARWRLPKPANVDPVRRLAHEMDMFIAYPYFRSFLDVPQVRKWLPTAELPDVLIWLSSVIQAVRRGCRSDARAFPRYQRNLRLFCRQVVSMARDVPGFETSLMTGLVVALRRAQSESPHVFCDAAFVEAVVRDLVAAAGGAARDEIVEPSAADADADAVPDVDERIERIRRDIIAFADSARGMSARGKEHAVFEMLARAYHIYQTIA